MHAKRGTIKKGVRLLPLLLCALFLFAGCGGEDKPFKQLCDINTGLKPKLSGLQDSGENDTRHMMITAYESYESTRDELKSKNAVELPKVKEKAFEKYAYLLIVHTVPDLAEYEYQVHEITVDQETLFVSATVVEAPNIGAGQSKSYQNVLVRLDKELVQDVQKVSVKTDSVDRTFSELS